LIVIPIYYIIFRQITLKQTCLYFSLVLAVLVLSYLIIINLSESANQSFQFYINERLINRISATATTNNRFLFLIDLCSELLIPLLITGFIFFYKRKTHTPFITTKDKQYALFFLLIGLSGSLPLMLTMVQKNFYFVASLPFFALSFSMLYYQKLHIYITLLFSNELRFKKIKIGIYIFFIISILTSVLCIGKTSRDSEKLKDITYLGGYLKGEKIVGVDNDTYFDWSFQVYIYRKYAINLDPRNRHQLYIITKSDTLNSLTKNYQKIDLPLKAYYLYKKR